MSTIELQHKLNYELNKLNEKIDLKILEGESYMREARRHKMLLAQLKRLNQQKQQSRWFSARPRFSFMSLFF